MFMLSAGDTSDRDEKGELEREGGGNISHAASTEEEGENQGKSDESDRQRAQVSAWGRVSEWYHVGSGKESDSFV